MPWQLTVRSPHSGEFAHLMDHIAYFAERSSMQPATDDAASELILTAPRDRLIGLMTLIATEYPTTQINLRPTAQGG